MAVPVNTIWYVNSVGWTAAPAWATGTVKAAGALVRQLAAPTVNNERVFVCIIAGTTHATTEPTWILTIGAKTVDNTITWMECTGRPAVNGDVTNTPASSGARSQAGVLGNIIKNNSATHYFICTTAGTCGAGEPSYNTTTGATTTDGTLVWTCIGAVGSFGAWAAPHARCASSWGVAIGIVTATHYVSSVHAETQAAALTIASPSGEASFICIADAGTIPPTAADITTGATVATTGSNAISINGVGSFNGLTFNSGSGAFAAAFNIATNAVNGPWLRFDNCSLNVKGTANPVLNIGSIMSKVEMVNTTLGLSGSGGLNFNGGHTYWRDTGSGALSNIGSWANVPIIASGSGAVRIENVDLTGYTFTGGLFNGISCDAQKIVILRSKFASTTNTLIAFGGQRRCEIDVIDCDLNGSGVSNGRWYTGEATQLVQTAVVRTGGASADGSTLYAWDVTSYLTLVWGTRQFESMPIAIWNPTTGANVVVTVEGITNAASLPNNDDIWLEVNYSGTASNLGSVKSGTKATLVTANAALPTSTEAWDSGATARQNSHVYSLGNMIKLASNPGRLFFCTQAGTSAGSEPGGYASAVDGGSVADGGAAIFRAARRFKLAVTLTSPQPQSAGYIYARVRVAKLSTTYYIDPKITLS